MESRDGALEPRILQFIRHHLSVEPEPDCLHKLSGDASTRQYFRYQPDQERSFIVTLYPEPFDPARFAYHQVYELMRKIDIPVPRILSLDGRLGIVMQQDLGDDSLERIFPDAPEALRGRLLQRACQHILRLQQAGPSVLQQQPRFSHPSFTVEKFVWELRFFHEHYLTGHRGRHVSFTNELDREFVILAEKLASLPKRLCHRDYHVRNLMLNQDRLYVIDFQDTRWGPPTYDLASLLKDSIQLQPRETEALIDLFLKAMDWEVDAGEFKRHFHLTCIQRLLKALGTYGYQIAVRHQERYQNYVAGSLRRLHDSLHLVSEFPCIRRLVKGEVESHWSVGHPPYTECPP